MNNESGEITGVLEYDGIGFKLGGIYRNPWYWREYKVKEKRYGKVKDGQADQKDTERE